MDFNDMHFDKFREACGVFCIYAPGEDVARLSYFGLYALQHRGQESAGIAVSGGSDSEIGCYSDMGLVTRVFSEKILAMMKGDAAVGHVRYSTTGSSVAQNAQPILVTGKHQLALAHNGNIVNSKALSEELQLAGEKLISSTDSEVIARMIARDDADNIEDAIANACSRLRGAFSIGILSGGKIFGLRDPHGIRPLCVGKLNGNSWVISSETCGLNIVGAELVREIKPGEIVCIDGDGLRTVRVMDSPRQATCVFEFIYFARPDSYILGRSLYMCRRKMGEILARESPVDADVVISVPDSGTPAAIGYARASGIPYGEGLIKNRYVGRTFINPDQRIRARGIKIKLNPLAETIRDKRVVLVDDSIVRGTTSSRIIAMLRECGAKELHVRVSSPPVKNPCFYGIDTADAEDLLANSRETGEIRDFLNADSLEYLSIRGMVEAIGAGESSFCMACFNGDYPIAIPQQMRLTKLSLEKETSRAGADPDKLLKR